MTGVGSANGSRLCRRKASAQLAPGSLKVTIRQLGAKLKKLGCARHLVIFRHENTMIGSVWAWRCIGQAGTSAHFKFSMSGPAPSPRNTGAPTCHEMGKLWPARRWNRDHARLAVSHGKGARLDRRRIPHRPWQRTKVDRKTWR
jgi:hypothetical protein